MSLLLLFRPKSGIGGEPEPEPPPVIVVTSSGVKKRKRFMSMKEFESRDTLEKFLKGQLAKQSPDLPDPLAEQRASEDRKRLKAQQKREAEMRRKAAIEAAEEAERKRRAVQAYNDSLLSLIAMMLEQDDDA